MTPSPSDHQRHSTPLGPEELAWVTELTQTMNLFGGRHPADAEEFWRAVGLIHSMAVPDGSAMDMARLVLERIGESWDDDFADDGKPSLAAYETLVARVLGQAKGDDGQDDDDDDATGDLAGERQIVVVVQDAPIQTITEWIKNKTLVLDPDWQRGYVWKAARRRRFIESIFLSLPIPPVLLFRDSKDRLYVIDGRQRLETVYRFHLGTTDRKRSFTTFSKRTPGWGDTQQLGPAAGKRFDRLPDEFQRRFNTFIIPARIFHNLERKKLYEVFKRYNTGGDKLNPAEIRNAVYQDVPLHNMLYRLAGEHGVDRFQDGRERIVAHQLRSIMKNKTARYGAYNFVGRVLAFSRFETGSVANAINQLMERCGDHDLEPLRTSFLGAFEAVLRWYQHPLCAEQPNGKVIFHEWVATIQMTSSIRALELIAAGELSEASVTELISREWAAFVGGSPQANSDELVGGVLQEKQNTTTHWQKQREWTERILALRPASS